MAGDRFYRDQVHNIALDDLGLATCLLNELGSDLQQRARAPAEHRDGAQFGQLSGDGGANPASRTGYDCHLSCQRLLARIAHELSTSRTAPADHPEKSNFASLIKRELVCWQEACLEQGTYL